MDSPIKLSASDNDAAGQQVVVDGNGLVIVIRDRFDGVNVFIFSSKSLNGGSWSTRTCEKRVTSLEKH